MEPECVRADLGPLDPLLRPLATVNLGVLFCAYPFSGDFGMKKKSRHLVFGATLTMVLAVIGYWLVTRDADARMERLIRSELPIGSSATNILRFLGAHGMVHGDPHVLRDRDGDLPVGTRVIAGALLDWRKGLKCGRGIFVVFILGEQDRLAGYRIECAITLS